MLPVCRMAARWDSVLRSSGSIAPATPLGDLVLDRKDIGHLKVVALCHTLLPPLASMNCAVMRSRSADWRTFPCST